MSAAPKCDCPDFKGPVDSRHVCPVHGPLYAEDGDAASDRERAEKAEQTIEVLIRVLPSLIVEAAEDFRNAWLDGRQPDLTDEKIRARLSRIVEEQFA